jgi:hypothetical protein
MATPHLLSRRGPSSSRIAIAVLKVGLAATTIGCGKSNDLFADSPPCDQSCAFQTCTSGELLPGGPLAAPNIRTHTTGSNGSFEDHCAARATLVKYLCETSAHEAFEEAAGPNPVTTYVESGRVLTVMENCPGGCMDGVCLPAPAQGMPVVPPPR